MCLHYHKVNTNLTVKDLPALPLAGWHYKVPICWSEPTRIFGKLSQIFKLLLKPGTSQRIPRIRNHLFVSKLFQTFTSLLLMLLGMSDCLKITRRKKNYKQITIEIQFVCPSSWWHQHNLSLSAEKGSWKPFCNVTLLRPENIIGNCFLFVCSIIILEYSG